MDRRNFLTGAGAMMAATASGVAVLGGDRAAAAEPEAAGGRPVLRYDESGGFLPAGYDAIHAAELVVYADGYAIAGAEHYARLSWATVDDLRRHAVSVLRDPANGRLRPGVPQIADAPSSHFVTRYRGRTYDLDAYALELYREYRGYPAATYALLDALVDQEEWVRTNGRPYRPDAVRLIAIRVDEPGDEVGRWPAEVPVPAFGPDKLWADVDLHGAAARAAVRAFDREEIWDWRQYRTSKGDVLSVAWRRLLPHERRR